MSFGWSSSPHRRKSSGPAAKKEEDEDDAEDSKSRVKTKDQDGSDDNESGDESKGKGNDADELVRKARYNLESLGNQEIDLSIQDVSDFNLQAFCCTQVTIYCFSRNHDAQDRVCPPFEKSESAPPHLRF